MSDCRRTSNKGKQGSRRRNVRSVSRFVGDVRSVAPGERPSPQKVSLFVWILRLRLQQLNETEASLLRAQASDALAREIPREEEAADAPSEKRRELDAEAALQASLAESLRELREFLLEFSQVDELHVGPAAARCAEGFSAFGCLGFVLALLCTAESCLSALAFRTQSQKCFNAKLAPISCASSSYFAATTRLQQLCPFFGGSTPRRLVGGGLVFFLFL